MKVVFVIMITYEILFIYWFIPFRFWNLFNLYYKNIFYIKFNYWRVYFSSIVLEATPHKAVAIWSLPPITKTIKIRWIRHVGHCWRSRDELLSDVLLWTPSHGWTKAGRLAQTYIQQFCVDMGYSPEDLPEVMNDREGWRERVRDICTDGTTRWWWYFS